MISYKRNITGQIIFLWVLLLFGIIAIVYFVTTDLPLISILIFFFLVALSFLQIRSISLNPNEIHIDKYFVYGFRRHCIQIDKKSSLKAELFVNGDIDQVPDGDTPLGLIIFLIPFLYKKYALWVKTSNNKTVIILKLTKKEFAIIEDDRRYNKTLPLTGSFASAGGDE